MCERPCCLSARALSAFTTTLSMVLFDWSSPLMRSLLPIVTFVGFSYCSVSAEEPKESININALLQNDDLLDALISGDETPEETIVELESESESSLRQKTGASSINPNAGEPSAEEVADISGVDSPWDFGAAVSMGIGYKENVLFSAFDAQDSTFTATEVEATLFRIASPNEWQFFGYFLGENAHYFDVDGLDNEWLAIGLLQAHKTFGDWKLGLAGQYTFLEQAFSLSFEDLDLESTKIVLNQFGLKPALEYQFLKHAYVKLELPLETNLFEDDLQNYNEYGVHVALGHKFKRGGKVEAGYRFELRDYDERTLRDEEGTTRPGTSLEWKDHRWSLALDCYLTAEKTWRSKTLLRLRRVMDNGAGYDNFWMYRAQQKFIYARPTWEISASASYSHYDYDTQTVDSGNSNHRHRSRLSLGCELEKTFQEDWTATLSYQFEDYLSNIPDDVYSGSVISLGLGYSF